MAIRLMIVDDHSIVRQSLCMVFGSDPEIEVVGEASNGKEALERARELKPHVILMDLLMPVMDGIAATAAVRRELPEIEVVATTSVVEFAAVPRAIQAGAIGYAFKDTHFDELHRSILAAAEGRVRLSSERTARLALDVVTPDTSTDGLDESECTILSLLAQEYSNQQIADALQTSDSAVRGQLDQILRKLQLPGRMIAALYAVRHGVSPGSRAFEPM